MIDVLSFLDERDRQIIEEQTTEEARKIIMLNLLETREQEAIAYYFREGLELKYKDPVLMTKLLDTGYDYLKYMCPWGNTFLGVNSKGEGKNIVGNIQQALRDKQRNVLQNVEYLKTYLSQVYSSKSQDVQLYQLEAEKIYELGEKLRVNKNKLPFSLDEEEPLLSLGIITFCDENDREFGFLSPNYHSLLEGRWETVMHYVLYNLVSKFWKKSVDQGDLDGLYKIYENIKISVNNKMLTVTKQTVIPTSPKDDDVLENFIKSRTEYIINLARVFKEYYSDIEMETLIIFILDNLYKISIDLSYSTPIPLEYKKLFKGIGTKACQYVWNYVSVLVICLSEYDKDGIDTKLIFFQKKLEDNLMLTVPKLVENESLFFNQSLKVFLSLYKRISILGRGSCLEVIQYILLGKRISFKKVQSDNEINPKLLELLRPLVSFGEIGDIEMFLRSLPETEYVKNKIAYFSS